MSDTNNQIEIVDEKPVEEVEINLEGATKEEIESAEEYGMIPKQEEKDGEQSKQSEPKTKENKHQEETKVDELPTFDQVETDEKLIQKYNKNEKALYWKWKTDKNKRQEAQKELALIKEKYSVDSVKASLLEKKLEKINKMLTEDVDNLTIEGLKAALSEKEVIENKIEEIKPNVDVVKQKVANKAQLAEKIGESTYENFQAIAELAKEVIDADKSGTYQSLIDKSFVDENIDEITLLERIVSIAKLSDKYSEISKTQKKEEVKDEKVNRVLNNSKKKISSASITSSGGRRTIGENELTCEQAAKLPLSEYSKLSETTRKRIKMGIDP